MDKKDEVTVTDAVEVQVQQALEIADNTNYTPDQKTNIKLLESVGGSAFTLAQFQSEEVLFQRLVKSGIVPTALDTPEKMFMVISFGAELGLTPMKSLNLIDIINGTPAPRSAWILGKCITCGITYEVIRNAEYVYYNAEGLEVYSPVRKRQKKADGSGFAEVKFRDVITTIKFSRKIDGQVMSVTAEFRFSEAEAAGLTGKDNWKYYYSDMLFWRCCTRGLRRLAPDLLWFYSAEELTGAVEFKD